MKKIPLLMVVVLSLAASGFGFNPPQAEGRATGAVQMDSSLSSTSAIAKNNRAAFSQLSLYPNIETIGIAVSGVNLPARADVMYRQSTENNWHSGPSLVRIDDGRLVGSLFSLSPSTSYTIRVLDGATEISGSISTQPNDLQFTPSTILHVNDDSPSGGDGSAAAPFRTIQQALDHAGPGTQVLVADGIYPEKVSFPNSGSPGNWIQVKAEGGAAILDGSETLTGAVWKLVDGTKDLWFVKIGRPIGYLARDQKRYYQYDDKAGMMQGRGHNGVLIDEGWFIEPDTWKLFVRSSEDPSSHTWQVPFLNIAFDSEGRDWLWIQGFEIRYYGAVDGCGVCIQNGSHVVVRNNWIHNLQKGIFINWTGGEDRGNDMRIEYNEISDPAISEWPWSAVKSSNMEGTAIILRGHTGEIVRGNVVHNFFNGIYAGSSGALENSALAFDADVYNNHIYQIMDDALEPEGACINQRFRDNTVENTLVGISLAPITQGPTWVLRNTFSNFTGKAIKWDRNSDGAVFIYHNTSWTNSAAANGMDLISPIRNVTMRNNIFQTNGYGFQEVLTGSAGNDWNYDNWYTTRAAASGHFKWENVAYNSVGLLCAASGLECKGYEGAPGLNNPGGGDFSLQNSSPNIDHGAVITGINDYFSGSAPDVGAIESTISSPPTVVSILRANENPTIAANVGFIITFSKPVSGVDLTDFSLVNDPTVSGASITSVVQISDSSYTIAVGTGSGTGTIRLDLLDNDSIADGTGSPLGGWGTGNGDFNGGELYTLEKSIPAVSSIVRRDPSPTGADMVGFTVTFNEEVSGLDSGDFAVTTSGNAAGASVTEVSGAGSVYTVAITTGSGDGTLRLDIQDDDSISDALGNRLGGDGAGNGNFSSGEVYLVDKNVPIILSSTRADADPTTASSVRFNVTFSEGVSGVDAADFSLALTDGLTGVSVLEVSGSADFYTVTAATGSGSGSLRLDLSDDDSILDSASHPLGGDGAGNGSFSGGEAYTINRVNMVPATTTFRSTGANDGWVLESSEDSNRGGLKNSNTASFNLGDDSGDRMYRAILHFPTNSLPDNAVVTQAILMIRKKSTVGSDPFTTHQNISIDIRKGAFGNFNLFSFWSLQSSDFEAAADQYSVGLIQNNPVSGWYWALLDGRALSSINLVGVTQFRLGFQLDDNDDRGDDYLKFYSGDSPDQTERPHLQIDYYVPR